MSPRPFTRATDSLAGYLEEPFDLPNAQGGESFGSSPIVEKREKLPDSSLVRVEGRGPETPDLGQVLEVGVQQAVYPTGSRRLSRPEEATRLKKASQHSHGAGFGRSATMEGLPATVQILLAQFVYRVEFP